MPGIGDALSGLGGLVASGLNQATSTTLWLGGAALSMTARGADTVIDGVASMTGMENGYLHKSSQVAISILDVGASLTKLYDLGVGNTATDMGSVTARQDIVADVRAIVNGNAPGVDDDSRALIATLVNNFQHVVPPSVPPMTEDQFIAAVFSGAHVVIADEGLQFGRWMSDENLEWQDRQSSHYQTARPGDGSLIGNTVAAVQDKLSPLSETPQKGIDLPRGLGHLLVGRMPDAEGGHTFFQLEAHGCSARDFLPHMTDFFLHKASGNAQVGPLGLIQASEKNAQHLLVNPGDPGAL